MHHSLSPSQVFVWYSTSKMQQSLDETHLLFESFRKLSLKRPPTRSTNVPLKVMRAMRCSARPEKRRKTRVGSGDVLFLLIWSPKEVAIKKREWGFCWFFFGDFCISWLCWKALTEDDLGDVLQQILKSQANHRIQIGWFEWLILVVKVSALTTPTDFCFRWLCPRHPELTNSFWI